MSKKIARAQVRLNLLQTRVKLPDPRTFRVINAKVVSHQNDEIAIERARSYCKKEIRRLQRFLQKNFN